jgi:maltose O-acetyltransferase
MGLLPAGQRSAVAEISEMKRRMLAGEPYVADDPELTADHVRCARLVEEFNATSVTQLDVRQELLAQLLGSVGADSEIRPPVYFDYGYRTAIGSRCFFNFGVTILDVGRVTIGDEVQVGPHVQLLTPTHPMDATERRSGWEAQKPITIGDGVWLAAGVIVCPGVTIGENAVVGAGAVVTRDVPPAVFAAGNPCRVVRDV